MLAVASAVCAVCLFGCGGDDNNPADNNGNNSNNSNNNNGNNNGGDTNHDGRLINNDGEAWLKLKGSDTCASPSNGTYAYVFTLNGDRFWWEYKGGDWEQMKRLTWQTNGNKLMLDNDGDGTRQIYTYEVSNSTLTMTRIDGDTNTYTKCSGLTLEW